MVISYIDFSFCPPSNTAPVVPERDLGSLRTITGLLMLFVRV